MALSFSHAVLAWARSKPADEAYRYVDNENCAVAQFLRETGRAKKPVVAGCEWTDEAVEPEAWRPFDWRVDFAANEPSQNTFGAFAARLEKALVR